MKSTADVYSLATYIAGGGLAGAFALIGIILPKEQALANGIAIAVVAIAGAIRVLANPTPTNTVQVFDRTTGSTVEMKTVAAPAAAPAPPPTYTAPPP